MLKFLGKRGSAWNLEFVIKLVVAVLCIFLILVVINSLFGIIQARHQLNQAKASLNGIVDLVNGIRNSDKNRGEFLVASPKLDKYIINFMSEDKKICVLTDKREIFACVDYDFDFVHIYYELDKNCRNILTPDGLARQNPPNLGEVPFNIIAIKRDSEPNKIYFTHLYRGDKCSSNRIPDFLRV